MVLSRNTRILVTGASGLLGANFVATAAEHARVVALHGAHPFAWPGVDSLGVNLRNGTETAAAVRDARPDLVVHLAAATNVDACETDPVMADEINVQATRVLAETATRAGAKFVYMSTDSVFAGTAGPYAEGDTTNPINEYARSKLAGEAAVRRATANHLIVRGSIYGWNFQPKLSLGEWVVARLEAGDTVPGFTDIRFTPLLVNSLSEQLLAMIAANSQDTWHLASRDGMSKYEFARVVAEVFGYSGDRVLATSQADARFKAPRPLNTSLDSRACAQRFALRLPSIRDDVMTFKRLRDEGFVARLKASTPTTAHV